jgi:hypothetical protein
LIAKIAALCPPQIPVSASERRNFFEPQGVINRAFNRYTVVPNATSRSSFAPKFLQTIYN